MEALGSAGARAGGAAFLSLTALGMRTRGKLDAHFAADRARRQLAGQARFYMYTPQLTSKRTFDAEEYETMLSLFSIDGHKPALLTFKQLTDFVLQSVPHLPR